MDLFKQNRFLKIMVTLLVILNLAALSMVWLGKPGPGRERGGRPRPEHRGGDTEKILRESLGFTDTQIERYQRLQKAFNDTTGALENEIRRLKNRMFESALQEVPGAGVSDSLLVLSLVKQERLERLAFRHFEQLKGICTGEQRKQLSAMMHEILRGRPEPPGGHRPPPRGR